MSCLCRDWCMQTLRSSIQTSDNRQDAAPLYGVAKIYHVLSFSTLESSLNSFAWRENAVFGQYTRFLDYFGHAAGILNSSQSWRFNLSSGLLQNLQSQLVFWLTGSDAYINWHWIILIVQLCGIVHLGTNANWATHDNLSKKNRLMFVWVTLLMPSRSH